MSGENNSSQMNLVGNIVHDLKTPIASIKSYADLIEQIGPLNEQQSHFLGRIQMVTEKMVGLG